MTTPDNVETKIALINNNVGYIQKDVAGINVKLDTMTNSFVTRIQLDAAFKTRDEKLDELSKAGNLWRWLSPTLAAVFGSILTFLLVSYIQNGR